MRITALQITPPFTEAEGAAVAAFRGVDPAEVGAEAGCGVEGPWVQSSFGHNGATHSYPARLFNQGQETGVVIVSVHAGA